MESNPAARRWRERIWMRLLSGWTTVLLLAGCAPAVEPPEPSASLPSGSSTAAPTGVTAARTVAPVASRSPPAASLAAAAPSADPPIDGATFARLFETLSEPDREFFSDNYVSNETSYLQVADRLLARAAKGGAYVGVGPEQNFTYLALTQPKLAFIVDLRRGNALEQLWYKALFDVARSRTEFLALLLGRAYDAEHEPGPTASLADVIATATRAAPDAELALTRHAALVTRIEREYGVKLSTADRDGLEAVQRAFFRGQLGLRFSLKHENGRSYPTLGALLAQRSPAGAQLGFLAVEAEFRAVQQLEHENRIVPVVGDFAGPHALVAVGRELAARQLTVGVFYVSNVEQYLLEPKAWASWRRNVAALPADERSLFVRCYLDQGRRHPAELPGHRTATVLATFADFESRWRSALPRSFYDVTVAGLIE